MSRSRTTLTVRTQQSVGLGRILLHTILTCVTGGFWLVILLIRFMLR